MKLIKLEMGKLKQLAEVFTAVCLTVCFASCSFFINIPADNETLGNSQSDMQGGSSSASESLILFEDFSKQLDRTKWSPEGLLAQPADDELLKKWVQAGNAVSDTHGKVFKLATFVPNRLGQSALVLTINIQNASVLSFDYRMDFWKSNYLTLTVNGIEKFKETGFGTIWRRNTVFLPPGNCKVVFSVKSEDSYYAPTLKNAAYIDNISITEDKIAAADIYPKGLQETYIGGSPIQFTAKALRADRSVIEGKSVTWSASGGSIDSEGLFTPETEGTYTVTAAIDGKQASNTAVRVHNKNYLADDVTIGKKTYTGAITGGSGVRKNTKNIQWADPTPNYSTFNADGFFVLKGTANNTYGYVKVTKGNYKTYYILPKGDFSQRIWLRFGPGVYTVLVSEMEITYYDTGLPDYKGDIAHFGWHYISGPTTYTMSVTNSHKDASEEDVYTMPSYLCQSDDFAVSNAVHAILAELPENASDGEKLRAIHDWQIRRMHYDNVSYNHNDRRKAQDAVSVLKYKMAVCEGYANLFTALERCIGIKGRYQSSHELNHAWNNTYYQGNWLLVDPTWNDPISSDDDSYNDTAPYEENYTYFLLTDAQDRATRRHHQSPDSKEDVSRSIVQESVPPKVIGMPDGWY